MPFLVFYTIFYRIGNNKYVSGFLLLLAVQLDYAHVVGVRDELEEFRQRPFLSFVLVAIMPHLHNILLQFDVKSILFPTFM